MTKKSICYDYVLQTKFVLKLWIVSITANPLDSLPQPFFDLCMIALHVTHDLHFRGGHALKNRSALISVGIPGHVLLFVNTLLICDALGIKAFE